MRIKVINPNTTLEMTEGIGEAARSVARPGTEIVNVSPEFGPTSIESYYDEYVAACGVLDEVRKGEEEDIDAYVIACYGDPGLHKCVAIRTTPLYVLDIEKDPVTSFAKLQDEVRRSVKEDDAEAVCLGCAGFAKFAEELENELGVPVLDGVVCATKQAEVLVELGKTTSKLKTYRPPEKKRFDGMFAHFSTDGSDDKKQAAAE